MSMGPPGPIQLSVTGAPAAVVATETEKQKRSHRRRQIVVRTVDELEMSRRDIHPEDDEFRAVSAHQVDVYGKTLDDDGMYIDLRQIDGPKADETCRLTIFARRGRWWWSRPQLAVRVEYDY